MCQKLQLAFQIEPIVPVRIGLHAGDVVFREGNVFGDAVNIASRVESMGIPGAILLSSNVRNQIKNQPEFNLTSLGRFEFKNVVEDMTVYALSDKGLPVPKHHELKGKLKTTPAKTKTKSAVLKWAIPMLLITVALGIWHFSTNQNKLNIITGNEVIPQFEKTIAVIPFRDLSPEQNQAYFADGIVEAIRSKLAQIGNLRVTSMTSVLGYRENPKSIGEIAKELKVDHILEGTIYRDQGKVRVIAQLIHAATDKHLWTQTYDEELQDIFLVQSNIANAVAKELEAKLSQDEESRLNFTFTTDISAYDYYLSALKDIEHSMYNHNLQSAIEANRKLDNAIAIDSTYDDFYVALAQSSLVQGWVGQGDNMLDTAEYYLRKAMTLNSFNDDTYALKSQLAWHRGDFILSKKMAEKALNLNPSNIEATALLKDYYQFHENNIEKAVSLAFRMFELDPQNKHSSLYSGLSDLLMTADMALEAKSVVLKWLALDKENPRAYQALDLIEYALGNFPAALEAIEYRSKLIPESFYVNDLTAFYSMMNGKYKESERLYKNNLDAVNSGFNLTYNTHKFKHRLAYVLWQLGKKEAAENMFKEFIEQEKQIIENHGGSAKVYDIAGAYAFTGQKELAYQNLEKMPLWFVTFTLIKYDPLFDSLREEDRFKGIMANLQKQANRARQQIEKVKVDGKLLLIPQK